MTKDWAVNNKKLFKRYEFENYIQALEFVLKVSNLAEMQNHHPDISFGWGYVEISLFSHDKKDITERDHKLAEAISKL
jgi:4a-hydroxytetrahydrobiopterin dehydratase